MFQKAFKTVLAYIIGFSILAPAAHADIAEEMKMMKSSENHGEFIENFAQLARDKKEQEILAALDPDSIKGIGNDQILDAFKTDVFPFFAQYQKMKPYEQITKAQVPDGRVGLWHYTYIIDTEGNTKPFQIAIIDTDGGLKVLSIIVGQCVKGRHPRIPPCQ